MDAVVEKVANDNAQVRFLIGTFFLFKIFKKFFRDFVKSYVQLHDGSFYHPFGRKNEKFKQFFIFKLDKLLLI